MPVPNPKCLKARAMLNPKPLTLGDQMQSHAADMDASLTQLHCLQSAAAGLQQYKVSIHVPNLPQL